MQSPIHYACYLLDPRFRKDKLPFSEVKIGEKWLREKAGDKWNTLSTKGKSLVFGYVRSNYHLYVPEMITKIFLLYFDQVVIIKFEGKDLQKLLQSPNKQCIKNRSIKLNQDLSFMLEIYPNGIQPKLEGFVVLGLLAKIIANNIDYYTICYEIFCDETQTLSRSIHTFGKKNSKRGRCSPLH